MIQQIIPKKPNQYPKLGVVQFELFEQKGLHGYFNEWQKKPNDKLELHETLCFKANYRSIIKKLMRVVKQ
ncbi:hypothetical protein EA772_11885 [Pedobacter sp. G11]|uniref:hypothetical protein n=1 Tax=Pedobacter sp. G11 TaxID=2482728 RepID=UPI000F5D7B07|nr:hypothetical protein [Pedobacter sp. G11]AZI26010.1 hypothetical protein EA772_11885 [Pedobacter sp. G11]